MERLKRRCNNNNKKIHLKVKTNLMCSCRLDLSPVSNTAGTKMLRHKVHFDLLLMETIVWIIWDLQRPPEVESSTSAGNSAVFTLKQHTGLN